MRNAQAEWSTSRTRAASKNTSPHSACPRLCCAATGRVAATQRRSRGHVRLVRRPRVPSGPARSAHDPSGTRLPGGMGRRALGAARSVTARQARRPAPKSRAQSDLRAAMYWSVCLAVAATVCIGISKSTAHRGRAISVPDPVPGRGVGPAARSSAPMPRRHSGEAKDGALGRVVMDIRSTVSTRSSSAAVRHRRMARPVLPPARPGTTKRAPGAALIDGDEPLSAHFPCPVTT